MSRQEVCLCEDEEGQRRGEGERRCGFDSGSQGNNCQSRTDLGNVWVEFSRPEDATTAARRDILINHLGE